MVRVKDQNVKLTCKSNIRVRFSDVDSMKIVWHGEYVRYFEDGREAFGFEYPGLGYLDIYEQGFTAPIVDLKLQYKRPLRYNDIATVVTKYIGNDSAKICFEYEIRMENGEIVATGSTVQVFLDNKGDLQLLSPDFYIKWKEKWNI